MVDWLCCLDFSFEFNSDTNIHKHKNRGSRARLPGSFNNRINSVIAEDVLLEDMCEMADIEYEGDATNMNSKDKNKMLTRLSKNPQTEQYFKDEKSLSTFFDNRLTQYTLELPGGFRPSNASRVSMGGNDSRLDVKNSRISHTSRISAASMHQRMSRECSRLSRTSRISGVKMNNRSSNLHIQHSKQSSSSNHELENHKRTSKTYDMANDIIKKRNSTANNRTSGIFQNLFNVNNSIYTEREDKKFGRDKSQLRLSESNQQVNNLDDLRKVRKSKKPISRSSRLT